MIYVVEKPHHDDPLAWFAFDKADFASKVAISDPLESYEIFDQLTPRELLGMTGYAPEDAAARSDYPAICALGDSHGWETALYRADYLQGRGIYGTAPVDRFEAHVAALQQRDPTVLIYLGDAAAIAATEGRDTAIGEPAHWRARHALYQQLVALEVLSDGGH